MRKWTWLGSICLAAVMLSLAVAAQAAPPAQDPQFGGAALSPGEPVRARISGTAINWGYRGEPDLHLTLTGAGWQMETVTDNAGRFSFDNLGEGFAVINPLLPPGSGLKPMTVDLAVPFVGPLNRVVNIGIYGGEQTPAGLPVDIQITPDKYQVGPGETISFTVTVSNVMPNDIHEVFVTDLFPPELKPLTIEPSVGAGWVGGQLAAAHLGNLAQGQGATVLITAVADPNLDPNRKLVNRASVFYAESVALQAEVRLNEPMAEPMVLPETGVQLGLPVGAGALLVAAMIGLRRLRTAR